MGVKLNDQSKTCAVQTFLDIGSFFEIIDNVDCRVRDYIDTMQQDWWYIANIKHMVLAEPGFNYGTYIVHVVMSRMHYDVEPKQY